LGVVDALLCGIDVDQSPADSSAKNLAQRLCRLEAMPAADVHAPGRDLGGAKLVDPPVSEGPHRLRKQPAQLRHGLGLAAVLRQVEIDELTQPWCLDEPCSRRSRASARSSASRAACSVLNPPRCSRRESRPAIR